MFFVGHNWAPSKSPQASAQKKAGAVCPGICAIYSIFGVCIYVFGDWREGFCFFKKVSQTELDFRNFHGQQVAFFCIFSWPNIYILSVLDHLQLRREKVEPKSQ